MRHCPGRRERAARIAADTSLPEGVRAGTVDRFQGRQGVVVLYSMASSSADVSMASVPSRAIRAPSRLSSAARSSM